MTGPNIEQIRERLRRGEEEKAERRRQWFETAKDALEEAQRSAARQDPWGRFQSKIPIDKGITDAEHEALLNAERAAYDREQIIARDKEVAKGAFVQAGGSEEAFEEAWRVYGRDAAISDRADALQAKALEEDSVF